MTHALQDVLSGATAVLVVGVAAVLLLSVDMVLRETGPAHLRYRISGLAFAGLFVALAAFRFVDLGR